uniref:Uncharacterized protein n=1 Tax=Aegilops tauschii subsp. strangulata TaxID=200361 RepID=A0A453M6B4_AEGTS
LSASRGSLLRLTRRTPPLPQQPLLRASPPRSRRRRPPAGPRQRRGASSFFAPLLPGVLLSSHRNLVLNLEIPPPRRPWDCLRGAASGGRGGGAGCCYRGLVVRFLAWEPAVVDGVHGRRWIWQASVISMGMALPSSVLALAAAPFGRPAARISARIRLRVGKV